MKDLGRGFKGRRSGANNDKQWSTALVEVEGSVIEGLRAVISYGEDGFKVHSV